MKAVRNISAAAYLIAIYLFVLAPLLIVVFASVNSAKTFPAAFEGLTFSWYSAILNYPEFIRSAWISALVAVLASVLALVVAFLAGYALRRGHSQENATLVTLLASPLLVPQIVMSLAMLQFLAIIGVGTSLFGLVAIHAVYVMPFALRLVLSGLARFDFALEHAALSLGASWPRTWFHITLPLLRPSLVAGLTFCFILSFVNLPISIFLTNPETATLPVVMFSYIESRINPMVAAVAAVIVIVAVIATVLLERFLKIRLVD